MHKFKRMMGLTRVHRVFGVPRSIAPENVLDAGCARGAFLWPFLDESPEVPVTAIDEDPIRSRDIEAVRQGGIDRLKRHLMDATAMDFPPGAFNVVTALEVLEHIRRDRVGRVARPKPFSAGARARIRTPPSG